MIKIVFSVMAVLPLVTVLVGMSFQTPQWLGSAKMGGVPALVIALLFIMAWLVFLAWWYLRIESHEGNSR